MPFRKGARDRPDRRCEEDRDCRVESGSTERTLAEHGAKLSQADRATIEQALSDAREALKGDDMSRIRQAEQGLTRASQKLAEEMYRDASGAGGGGDGAAGQAKEGDVVDAEFRDVDERKS